MLNSFGLAIVGVPQEMIGHWRWFLAFGILLALIGIIAITRSLAATVASMVFFGSVLLVSSVVEFAGAFMVGHWTGFFLHLLAAILLLVTGLLVLTRPMITAEVATLVMSMFFLIGGLYQIVASLVAGLPGSGWEAFDGVIATIMGVVLLLQWPVSGLWAIGLFVGIDLIFSGWSWIALAFDLRNM